MKIKETEKLKFTDERPFHMSQRHSKLSINQQSHLGKCSEGKLRISALVNEGTLRSTADFASALICSNIWCGCISCSIVVFFPFYGPKINCCETYRSKVARLWKHPLGRFFFDNFKNYLVEFSLHFHLQLCKKVFEWLLSYEIISCKKE